MTPTQISFQNEFIPVVASDHIFRSGMKFWRTFHKYRVKEVRAHSGRELGTWIGWADQLIGSFDPPMFLPHFHTRMTTSM